MARLLVFLLALSFALPDSASAQTRASRAGRVGTPPPTTSLSTVPDLSHGSRSTVRVSGTDLPGGTDLIVPDGGWVTSVKFAERSDDPCYLELGWATMDNGQLSRAKTTYANCGAAGEASPPSSDIRGAGFSAHPSQGQYLAMKGLQVCQRNATDKVKGIRVRAVELRPNGSHVATRPFNRDGDWREFTFERTNCNDWDDMEMCPNGEVMIGVHIEHENATAYRSRIKGLAPICTQLQIRD